MLNKITLNNFKAARNLELPLAPLSMLAGLNGSGKSTVLQSIAAIYQSYLGGQINGFQLGGSLVQLGQGRDVLNNSAPDETLTITLKESGKNFCWSCNVDLNANELELTNIPGKPPKFLITSSFQYLQADRIVPRSLFPQGNQHSRQFGFLGAHGEYTADFLANNSSMQIRKRRHCNITNIVTDESLRTQIAPTGKLSDQVAGWLQQISPGVHLQSEPLIGTDEVLLQFRYIGTEHGRSKSYRPTHVGFGLTYSLPIIVACLAAKKGDLLLLENPEAHLHPQGQAKIGELLALCATDGVQILVETHSDHLLNGIRLAVKRRAIPENKVKLSYFTRDISSGDCYVETPSILADGQLSNWPDGFFDQWEKDLDALLD